VNNVRCRQKMLHRAAATAPLPCSLYHKMQLLVSVKFKPAHFVTARSQFSYLMKQYLPKDTVCI